MARVTAEKALLTKNSILDAAKHVLRAQGYSGLSIRNIAAEANVPLSQIQYHFGSKEGMVLALYEYMNAQLLDRQQAMFSDPEMTFTEKWTLACDYLDADIESGYVHVFQELTAAGWTNKEVGQAIAEGTMQWVKLINEQVDSILEQYPDNKLFTASELTALISCVFVGAESNYMLGLENRDMPIRQALRQFGKLICLLETHSKQEV
jgi:AcrR family transcriptional regulator